MSNLAESTKSMVIPSSVWRWQVAGRHLTGETLMDQLAPDRSVILMFLRQLGCVFCRQAVSELRQVASSDYPEVVFFHQGSVAQGDAFFAQFWPEARAISDASCRFYKAFDIQRGTMRQLFGLRSMSGAVRALARGYRQGKAIGDVRMLSSIFVARRDRGSAQGHDSSSPVEILWHHGYRHAGDHPDFRALSRFGSTPAQSAAALDPGVDVVASGAESVLDRAG